MLAIDARELSYALQLYRVAPWHLIWPWRRRVLAAIAWQADGPLGFGMFGVCLARVVS